MHPNYMEGLLLAHDPSHHWPTLWGITHTPLIAGNLPINLCLLGSGQQVLL